MVVAQGQRDAIVLQNAGTKADLANVVKEIAAAQLVYVDLLKQLSDAKIKLNQAKAYYERKRLEYARCQYGFWYLPSANDGSCQANVLAADNGAGRILYTDNNAIIIGDSRVYIGSCSDRQYAPGKDRFDISDRVEYEGHRYGNTVWAKKIKCTCA